MQRRPRRRRPVQLTLDDARKPTGRGGWRPNAGRPRGHRVAHSTRERFAARFPLHVTLRVRDGLPSLRRHRALVVVRRALVAGGHKRDFRVVHFNLLPNHLHLIVEAQGAERLARGMQGLEVRLARALNRLLDRRGRFFADRYHARALRTPRETRHAIRYVLLNGRHHAAQRGQRLDTRWIDPYSSAPWFDGWRHPIRAAEPWLRELLLRPAPTAPPSVWLLTTGWRRGELLATDERTGRPP